jgi:hypothetical protein
MRFPKPNMEFSYLPSVGYESFLESISHKENSRVSWNIQSILFTIRCICGQIVVRNTDIRFASIYLATRWSFSGMTLNLKGTPVGTYCIGVYSCLIGIYLFHRIRTENSLISWDGFSFDADIILIHGV